MRKITLLLSMLVLSVLVFAQRTVTGTVRDDKGEPIPFATVSEVGKNNAVTADANGVFSIRVAEGAQLQITASGHQSQTITVTGNTVTATLTATNQQLTEVVVTTALGQQRQARELGYSTARVRAQEVTQSRPVNLQNGLTGKVSGLNIQTVNSGVFENTRITLRGIRSLTGNNQPMLVLDGVPIALSFLNSINPNDIQDVNILKSAAATAVYGPDGVNGAIVVTTRRGSRNRPTISASHTFQLSQVSFMPKFQTRFGSGSSVDINGMGVYDPVENQGYGDEFDGSPRQIGRSFDRNGDGDTDDEGETQIVTYEARPEEKQKFWDLGATNQTDLSFSTGDFYMSAQNVMVNGVLPKDQNKRTTLRLSAQKEYNRFRANFNVNYALTNYDVNAGSQFGNGRDYTPYWNLINTPMQIPITRYKDWRNDFWSNPNYYFNDYYHNPYWYVDNFRETGRSDNLLGNIELNFKATTWLNLTYRLGGTVASFNSQSVQYPFTYNAASKASGKSTAQSGDITGGVINRVENSNRLNSELFATTSHTIGKIRLDGLLGHSFRETNQKLGADSTLNIGIPEVFNIAVRKGELQGRQEMFKTRLQRFFGRVGVGYDNWAFAELTGSYDFDSRLADPNNFNVDNINYFYPGVSVSFVLSEAVPAIKSSNLFSYLKVRGSISKSANPNLNPYSLENTFLPGTNFPFGNLLGFSANDVLLRNDYQPEFVNTKEAGLEVGFLRNRINFEATYYTQDNTNQLITVAYSAASGYTNALLNAASFINKGVELDLRLTPLVRLGGVNIDFKVNYTYQTNEVTRLIEGVDELGIGNGNFVIVGKPAYTFKLTDYVRDSLGRVVVDMNTGFPTVDPVTKTFGRTLPTHLLGLNLNASWKGLNVAIVADHRTGNQIYSGIGPDMDFSGVSYRTGQNGRQPFIFPNSSYFDGTKHVPNTTVYTPGGYSFWSQAVNTSAQSNYLASGAFWKLREVSIGYNLPARWFGFSRGAVKGATFTLTGRNLYTWLPGTNQWTDPEFSVTTGNAQGVNDRNNNPPTRIYGANLTLNF